MIRKVRIINSDKCFIVDEADYLFVANRRWHLYKTLGKEYISTSLRIENKKIIPPLTGREIGILRREKGRQRFGSRKLFPNSKRKNYFLHRLLMNAPSHLEVDHINGNGLDNRRGNLRLCTRRENGRNRKLSGINTSGFHGVHFSKDGKRQKRWTTTIRTSRGKKYIGRFHTKEEAALAYNKAAKKYHKKYATLNII